MKTFWIFFESEYNRLNWNFHSESEKKKTNLRNSNLLSVIGRDSVLQAGFPLF